MTKDEIRAAYRAFNKASRDAFRLQRHMREADALIASLQARRRETIVRELTDKMQDDPAFCRVLRAFTGHTAHGWACACGQDGRMKSLLRDPGWDLLREVIRRIRWRLTSPRGRHNSGVDDICRMIDAENGL